MGGKKPLPNSKDGVPWNSKPSSTPVKILGLEFSADLFHLSWKRRQETLSVIVWFVTFILWPALSYQVLFLCFFIPPLRFPLIVLVIPYLVWVWFFDMETCHTGGRPWQFCRRWTLWKHFNDYFPIKLVNSGAKLDPTRNYLFCGHPHGLMCIGIFGCFATEGNSQTRELFPQVRRFAILTFDASFKFPFTRELVLGLGLCSASRKSMNHVLSEPGGGNVAILIPGGAPEALDFCPGKYILQLKQRKGFVKVALQNGSPLVPVFSFGENTVLNQISNPPGSFLRRLQDTLQRLLSIPPVLFYGRGVFQYTLGFLPKRKPITVVVGAPIPVEKVDSPTSAQIDELHAKYVAALTTLFETHKGQYSADPKDTLVIR